MTMQKLTMKPARILAVCLIAGLFSFLHSPGARSDTNVQVGVLKCTVEGGVGLILGSSKGLTCVFKKSDGTRERYSGTVKKFGLDIGVTKKSKIAWVVFAPSGHYPNRALAGSYVGLSAEITVAGGVGANLLIGGLKRSITLQPLSIQVQEGFNIAAGIGTISLRYLGD